MFGRQAQPYKRRYAGSRIAREDLFSVIRRHHRQASGPSISVDPGLVACTEDS